MKYNKKIVAILIIVIIILCGIVIKLEVDLANNKEKNISLINDSQKFKQEYEKLNGAMTTSGEEYNKVNILADNPIEYIELDELINIVNNEEAYIYISNPTCPYCRATVPILLEVANKFNIDKIYYYDTLASNYYDKDKYEEIMKQLQDKEIVRYTDEKKWQWGIPLLIKVKNGGKLGNTTGVTYKLNEGQSKYDELTDEQKEKVYNRYNEFFSNNI